MLGYWQNEKATAAVLQDGWFSTGDLGQIDNDGFLKITGRKKELIVTAGGKNIAPVHLESLLTRDPLIQQAVVIGEGRRYLTALVVPEENMLLQAAHGCGVHRPEESSCDIPELREIIRFCIETQLAEVSQHEKIGKFSLLARPFSIEHGELTPKLSLRRHVIEQNYHSEIESMYRS
jgi:long-chain acyl-CoA synthetase